MIRTSLMLAFSAGSALLVMPLLTMAQTSSSSAEASRKFRAYLHEDWKRWMQEYPETATLVGFPGQNRRWRDDSREGLQARIRHLHESLTKLDSIPRDRLPAEEQFNYDLYRELLETAEEGLQYGDDPIPFRDVVPSNSWMPITQMGGIQQGAAEIIAAMPHQTVADYEDILARLAALPGSIEQNRLFLQEGVNKGYTPPKLMLRNVPKQIAGLIPADPLASPPLEPFKEFPAGFPEVERIRLTDRAKKLYASAVAPAFQKLHDYVTSTYLPACRESIAATALPNGAAAYAFHVRWQTTTNLTPQQIHEIGLSEVKRIRVGMDKVIASAGFQGSFHDFTEFLRTDPRFYYDKAEDLVNGYRIIAKKADPQLAHLFGKLPRLPYGVTPIPEFKAPSQTTAYYDPGSFVAGRPGYMFANTYKLESRPKWEMEALTLHEAVPGHHIQVSLAQELQGLPEFRKNSSYTAFVEGWGLYAESLGEEMGFYKDPYSKFGQLTYEMWRAVRLVVDTGLHSMGWTRDQAINFFRENAAKTDQDIIVEVDRYIVWPGQALGYKMGQLKIQELRTKAERQLGPRFDIRQFHDVVLGHGAVPLDLLEQQVNAWVQMR